MTLNQLARYTTAFALWLIRPEWASQVIVQVMDEIDRGSGR